MTHRRGHLLPLRPRLLNQSLEPILEFARALCRLLPLRLSPEPMPRALAPLWNKPKTIKSDWNGTSKIYAGFQIIIAIRTLGVAVFERTNAIATH